MEYALSILPIEIKSLTEKGAADVKQQPRVQEGPKTVDKQQGQAGTVSGQT